MKKSCESWEWENNVHKYKKTEYTVCPEKIDQNV